jgi:hypothetical protein
LSFPPSPKKRVLLRYLCIISRAPYTNNNALNAHAAKTTDTQSPNSMKKRTFPIKATTKPQAKQHRKQSTAQAPARLPPPTFQQPQEQPAETAILNHVSPNRHPPASPTRPPLQPSPTHGQTVHHTLINHSQRANPRKRHAEKLNSLLHTHSIFRWLDLLNKRITHCLNKRIRFQAGPIVATIPLRLVATKKPSLTRFMTASLYALSRPFRARSGRVGDHNNV